MLNEASENIVDVKLTIEYLIQATEQGVNFYLPSVPKMGEIHVFSH